MATLTARISQLTDEIMELSPRRPTANGRQSGAGGADRLKRVDELTGWSARQRNAYATERAPGHRPAGGWPPEQRNAIVEQPAPSSG